MKSRFETGVEGAVPVEERLERLLAGDSGAAAWLFDTFAPLLLRRLGQRYGYLGAAEIEDLLQETFLLVLRRDGRLLAAFLERVERVERGERTERGERSNGPPGGGSLADRDLERFLWDQACGLASNRRRSASFRNQVPMADSLEVGGSENAEQQVIDRDSLARLDGCLRVSGDRVYLYYKLRYRDGLTPEQVADATGWSRKATYKLRQALDEAVRKCVERLGLFAP